MGGYYTTPEDRLTIACSNYMKFAHPDLIFFHIANERKTKKKQNKSGNWYSPEGKKLKDMGVLSGVCDCFLDKPAHGFAGLRIELKTEKIIGVDKTGKPRFDRTYPDKDQKSFLIQSWKAGYAVAVCRNIDEFKETVENYLNGCFSLSEYMQKVIVNA